LGVHSGSPDSILYAERELFGWDHCEAGRQLIADWNMPPEFEPIVSEHHAPRNKESPWGMADLISVSCRMADAVGCAAFPGCEITEFPDLLNELPERERRLFHATLETLTAEIARKIDSVESA
jgi:hypothetical protein